GDGVDGHQSDVGVVVGGWDDSLDGVTFIVENMTLATLGGAVENDSLYLALYVDDREGAHDLADLITRFDVSQGDVVRIDEDQHYLNFEIEFDLNGAADGGEFNLVLSNVVTETEDRKSVV